MTSIEISPKKFVSITINEHHNFASSDFRSNLLGEVITENPSSKATPTCQSQVRELSERESFLATLGDILGRGIFNVNHDSWMFQ